ncbi:MAG: DUF456 domain-containing protein [Deltaproteobacteria bacterium]|jgi:uncharacterized protein YqgC (DUF456 family)|nr:DUF456 domain-containing protein [Deltaproteobacteria bacterium]
MATIALMLIGLIGSVLPFIPGSPLILLGAFIYAWYTDFLVVTWGTLVILLLLTVLSQILDYLASILGAKKFGASRWGMSGAFLGGIIGLFSGGILGILIGPFIGALLLELLHGQDLPASLKIGLGTLVGFLGGAIGKIIIALTMIGIFLVKIIG